MFAQIPFEIICRFSELNKVEIVVFSCLMAHKNQATGLCNPKPVLISKETDLDKGNVSKAIKTLESKGWVIWLENGEFSFPILGEKVVNLTTFEDEEKLLIQQPKVVNSTTQVVNLTTSLNKEFKHKNNIKENIGEGEPAAAPPPPPAKPKKSPADKGTRIPDPFVLTAEMQAWAGENCPGVDAKLETKMFVNHFRGISSANKNAFKNDWLGAWENWLLGEFKKLNKQNGGRNHAKPKGHFGDKDAKFDANLQTIATDPAFGFAGAS
jgi:hypothetical protein